MSTSVLDFDAFIIDLDGVVTDAANLHARPWRTVLDAFLLSRRVKPAGSLHLAQDYARFVHGRSRIAAVRSFLASRELDLAQLLRRHARRQALRQRMGLSRLCHRRSLRAATNDSDA